MDFLNMEKLSGMVTEYAPAVVGAILTLFIGLWIIGMIAKGIDKAMKNNGIDDTLRPFLKSLVGTGMKILLLLSVAGMFGIETTSFIAIFGALTLALSLIHS